MKSFAYSCKSECPREILEFPIFPLANDLHIAYSTLYLRTVYIMAKWTIANSLRQRPLEGLFARVKKPSFVRKTDGISTEPDTWKGL